jgi:HAD superfamily hydrolase (TIGR01450 family)
MDMCSLDSLKCYVLDMDGTIYLGNRVIAGAFELLALLRERRIPYYFFTNNSSKSPEDYIEKLRKLGFGEYTRADIITSADVTADYISKRFGCGASAYIVGTPSLVAQMSTAGIRCTDTEVPDCVVVGFDTTFDYAKADRATMLLRQGVPFLATNIDAVCPLEDGAVLPDCASICAMLTHATGKQPKFLGKPFAETAEYIMRYTGVPAAHTAVIGDRLYTDMRLALDNGMCAIGVLSGEMTKEDIEQSGSALQYLFPSAMDLYEGLKKGSEA